VALFKFEKTAVFAAGAVNTLPIIDTAHHPALLNDLEISQQGIQKEALPEMENHDVSEAALATSDVKEQISKKPRYLQNKFCQRIPKVKTKSH
jgi:hypothetical protein